jgi:hypothetical protein
MPDRSDITQPIVIPLIAEAIVALGLFVLWLAYWAATP